MMEAVTTLFDSTGNACLSRTRLTLAFSLAALAPAAAEPAKQIVEDRDRFEFHYQVTVPKLEKSGRLWLPLARSDEHQAVELVGVTTAQPWQRTEDKDFGNTILTMEVAPSERETTVEVRYRVERREKSAYETGPDEDVHRHLAAEALVPRNERLIAIARRAAAEATTGLERGEALYRHTLDHMAYDKSGKGWGRGDALHACDSAAGNCTDFHAYFIGLARAVGIPARFAIGFTIPADRDEGEIGGYHCWAEFHAGGKWIPVDISEADKHPSLADYYLGRHPANRFQLTLGRDLKFDPAPASGPVNYLIYPLLEVGGREVPVERLFTFKRLR